MCLTNASLVVDTYHVGMIVLVVDIAADADIVVVVAVVGGGGVEKAEVGHVGLVEADLDTDLNTGCDGDLCMDYTDMLDNLLVVVADDSSSVDFGNFAVDKRDHRWRTGSLADDSTGSLDSYCYYYYYCYCYCSDYS